MSTDIAAWLAGVRAGVATARPDAGAFGQHVSVLTTTGSTNDDVARAAFDGAPQGYTVIAGEQTAGRGRRGAAWHSPAAQGLYVSTLLRPDRWSAVRADPASPAPALITLMAGAAVVSAIGDVGPARAELKWPNDVMVRRSHAPGGSRYRGPGSGDGEAGSGSGSSEVAQGPAWRKLAGILAEGASEGGVLRSVVIGIGVNLRRGEAPAELAARMIALDELLPEAVTSAQTLSVLVCALLTHLRRGVDLLAGGAADDVRRGWLRHAPSVDGTPVRWRIGGETRRGHSAGIDGIGALRVRLDDGAHVTIHGGAIEWDLEDREA